MRLNRVYLLALLAAVAACGGDDDNGVKPTGPVTIAFATPVYELDGDGQPDTVPGELTIDPGTASAQTISIPSDSLFDISRGEHTFSYRIQTDYLSGSFTASIDPRTDVANVAIFPVGSCRRYDVDNAGGDANFCSTASGSPRTLLAWSGNQRFACAAGDWGELCNRLADRDGYGGTMPSDSSFNEYVALAKLLIAARAGEGGNLMAMTINTSQPGDYYPRTLFRRASASDSTRAGNELWTDARHFPLYQVSNDDPFPTLQPTDRPNDRFGLSVKITYHQPARNPALSVDLRNAIFARYDITNISNDPAYQFHHPNEPAGRHTITEVYLAPVIDPDIGYNGTVQGAAIEVDDDNATVLPQDSLLVAYDRDFRAAPFRLTIDNQAVDFHELNPSLVGLQLISGPPGTTASGILWDDGEEIGFRTDAIEDNTFHILAAGRAGTIPAGCQDRAVALVCSPETNADIRMGWSVGPLSLAPGQSTSLVVAILLAPPAAGTFTSGTGVAPGNDQLATTASPITPIAANLQALAAQTKTIQVQPLQ